MKVVKILILTMLKSYQLPEKIEEDLMAYVWDE